MQSILNLLFQGNKKTKKDERRKRTKEGEESKRGKKVFIKLLFRGEDINNLEKKIPFFLGGFWRRARQSNILVCVPKNEHIIIITFLLRCFWCKGK